MLASVAEQASLSLTWWETPEDMFSHDKAHIFSEQDQAMYLSTLNLCYIQSLFNQRSSAHGFSLVLLYSIKNLE